MNLDSCTPGQRAIITTLDRPLMVSAGAGSGKTFTLTQRIAFALERPDDAAAEPFARSVDEVIAITFTKKAAAELKSRVKRRLGELGLAEEALKVDDAWISTIHGMCARLLREHALEVGIDPAFEVMAETDARACREAAFDEVMESVLSGDEGDLRAFVRSVGVRASQSGSSVEEWVAALTERASALPGGFDALADSIAPADPAALLRQMVELGEGFVARVSALPRRTRADERHCADMERALERAAAYFDTARHGGFSDVGFDAERFAGVFFGFPKTSPKYRVKDGDDPFFADYRAEYARLGAEAEASLAARELAHVVRLARDVDAAYRRIKGPTRLDNTDLLRLAHRALVEHPSIAEAYRRRFKLIMIDEFQDTDELQVALISALAQPGLSNVCTVGDAQQSIYRFRGADVNVFYGYRDALAAASGEARFVSLPDNFRSHADVLSFVDAVFSQPSAFGDEFLSLAPKGAVNNAPDLLFEGRPRIQMALFDYRRGGPGVREAQGQAARRIARHFADLRADGASPADMVVLLGKMSQADLYAQALRDEGFECVVAGGSTFSEAEEVVLIEATLRFLADPLDDEALYRVLASPLFDVGDDALLHLVTRTDREGRPRRRTLSQGMAAWRDEQDLSGLPEAERDRLDFAALCLEASRSALADGLVAALEELVRASGWLERLERQGAQGQAVAGNVAKALRMVVDIEKMGLGLARSVDRFAKDRAALKLAPGTLSGSSSNFVRLMTVHASKGLEFPHVALADLRLTRRAPSITVENVSGRTYASLRPVSAAAVRSTVTDVRAFADPFDGEAVQVEEASTLGERSRALDAYAACQEVAEQRRLLYVALTRASKSVFVTVAHQGKKDGGYEGVLADLYGALGWEANPDAPVQMLDYGGTAPLRFEYTLLSETIKPALDEVLRERPAFLIPPTPPVPSAYSYALTGEDDDVCSYTSLHRFQDRAIEGAFGAADDDATALGTAFHRLAQASVELAKGARPVCPDAGARAAQARACGLSLDQIVRLDRALERWFASDELARIVAFGPLRAEVPFMVCLEEGFLEGEIDLMARDAAGAALVVDYKTGGSPLESPADVEAKHLLQAQCYALALLDQGAPVVELSFVRVELPDAADPDEPQVQRYRFVAEDRAALEAAIRAVAFAR